MVGSVVEGYYVNLPGAHAEFKCCARSRTAFEQFVGGHQFALEIRRNQKHADENARDDVTGHDLQIREISALFAPRERGVGKRRHSDQRERAGLGRDNRETRSTKCFLRRSLTVRCDRRKSVPKTVIPTRWSNKTA